MFFPRKIHTSGWSSVGGSGRGRVGVGAMHSRENSYAPINVNPVGLSVGKGWGFDKF